MNELLKDRGIGKKIRKLSDCSPSMFVILFESMFNERIPKINRDPKTSSHHVKNLNILLDHISNAVLQDGSSLKKNINAEKVYIQKDERSIKTLIRLFRQIFEIIQEHKSELSDSAKSDISVVSDGDESEDIIPAIDASDDSFSISDLENVESNRENIQHDESNDDQKEQYPEEEMSAVSSISNITKV